MSHMITAPEKHESARATIAEWTFAGAALLPLLAAGTWGIDVALMLFCPLLIAACLLAAALDQHWQGTGDAREIRRPGPGASADTEY